MIREAEGEAEAILKVQQANADGIRFLKEAGADESVLTLKSLEALKDMADGKATKIIVPSDLQGLAGLATSLKEIMTDKILRKNKRFIKRGVMFPGKSWGIAPAFYYAGIGRKCCYAI